MMKCNFCDKPSEEVKWLLARNPRMAICDECVQEGAQILATNNIRGESPSKFILRCAEALT